MKSIEMAVGEAWKADADLVADGNRNVDGWRKELAEGIQESVKRSVVEGIDDSSEGWRRFGVGGNPLVG
jgi:hypothetical protein